VTVCSIVIPVYNWASVTRQCLKLLFADPPGVETEIIVVDDGSRDSTPQVLAGWGSCLRTVTHERNLGFAAACNDGAAIARGEYLVFLNNDTMPKPGWLDALAGYADQHREAAVVGSKILHADGTIQHAGVAIGQDRFSRHIYRGFPGDHPAVNRARRFQAVTGACMLVRRAIFQDVAGFDTGFRNAYEDHDLCLRIGELGHEIHYCPTSEVYHLEQVTRVGCYADFAQATALYRQRWAHRLVPDDLEHFVRDGLIRLIYDTSFPVKMRISPLVGVIDAEDRSLRADRLLDARARQVSDLLNENARLHAQLLEAEARVESLQRGQQASPPDTADPEPSTVAGDDARLPALHPPPDLVRMVGGEFESTGAEFTQYFLSLCQLQPTDSVLDVGCGIGRMAVPLTRILGAAGQYAGFDVMERAIEWCRANITPPYPNFRFDHAPTHNTLYNPSGVMRPSAYTFPYEDASFDFVFLTSVFTHMLSDDVDHYVSEIARVLKPGGRCFVTFFLLNDESRALIQSGLTETFTFGTMSRVCAPLIPEVPEAAIAYDETYVRQLLHRHGLTIREPIHYGSWCGRLDGLSLQDFVIATKAPRQPVS
jgi:GT2 family glycosyltransferase/ubiquinone/menaquinone biosynthesis C-methylase UbiE